MEHTSTTGTGNDCPIEYTIYNNNYNPAYIIMYMYITIVMV